jgi:hypothetical protein
MEVSSLALLVTLDILGKVQKDIQDLWLLDTRTGYRSKGDSALIRQAIAPSPPTV